MKYWNTTLTDMTEYIPGEQPENLDQYIKLNTNENPFPPSPAALKAIQSECGESLRRYPNPVGNPLRETAASTYGLLPENVFVANGSDEIFTLLFRGFINHDQKAAFCYPSYSLYSTMAQANAIPFDTVNLKDDFSVDFDTLQKGNYRLIILCNPNNPTGSGIPTAQIQTFLEKYKGLLVVDEAYVDFYGETVLSLVNRYDNLIVTRSFSKSYSLAGLRVGLAFGHKDLIRGFEKLKDSYNVDRLALAGAEAALRDTKTFQYNLQMVRSNKEYLEEILEAMDFEIVPSKANFLFVRHKTIAAEQLYLGLKERMILIRHFKGSRQELYVRISIGTMMEIKKLLAALTDITTTA